MNKNRNPPSKKSKICKEVTAEILRDMLGAYAVSYHYGDKAWYIFPREHSKGWMKLTKSAFEFIEIVERKKRNETL